MYRRRKLGLTDELLLRRRQVDEDEVGRGKRIAMFLAPADPPHLRPEKRSGLFLVPLGEVEQIVRHPRMVPGQSDGYTGPPASASTRLSTRLSQAAARNQGTLCRPS